MTATNNGDPHDDMSTTPKSTSRKRSRRRRERPESRLQSLSNEALITHDSSTSFDNHLLEDATGHINRVLAERIFHWEQQSRSDQDLPKVDYSIRSGLRLVEQLVRHILEERNGKDNNNNDNNESQDTLYADLVQEGLVALLDAMKSYREEEQQQSKQQPQQGNKNNSSGSGFALYAQQEIRKQLESRLGVNLANKPLRLPQSVSKLVQQARVVARQLQSHHPSRQRPSAEQIAQRLQVPVAQLRDYIHVYKRTQPPTLSVESTVEISHPLLDDTTVQFTNQDDWEKEQQATTTTTGSMSSASSDNSKGASSSSIIHDDKDDDATDQWISEYFMDTLLEGDDQAWIVQQEQHAGSLTDLIPDTQEPSPDDQVLTEMIRNDLYKFLATTVTEQEHNVIRTVFGLDTGKQVSLQRAATELSLPDRHEVQRLLSSGLHKLRESYQKRYVEPYLESEPPSKRIIDSV